MCVVAVAAMLTSCRTTRTVAIGADAHVSTIGVPGGGDRQKPDTSRLTGDDRRLVDEAMTWLGTPYRYGGQDYTGTDCSGFTMEVYRKALGIKLPRSSREQMQFCIAVGRGALTIGDLLFFCTGSDRSQVSHVGIYIGDGRMVHASGSKGVIISNIDERYYTNTYYSSGHVARSSDNARTSRPAIENTQPSQNTQPTPKTQQPPKAQPSPKTQPSQKTQKNDAQRIELNRAVEERIDSIYSGFLD